MIRHIDELVKMILRELIQLNDYLENESLVFRIALAFKNTHYLYFKNNSLRLLLSYHKLKQANPNNLFRLKFFGAKNEKFNLPKALAKAGGGLELGYKLCSL